MQSKVKNILIIVLSILFIGSLVVIYKLTTKDVIKEITGEVIVTGTDYIIVEYQDSDYLVNNIKGTYNVGDEVKLTYNEKDLKDEESPKVLKILDEDLVKASTKEDNNTNENNNINSNNGLSGTTNTNNTSSGTSSNNNTSSSNNTSSNNTQNNGTNNNAQNNISNNNSSNNSVSSSADEAVLTYFNNLDSDFKASSVKDSLKSGFVTVVDFLFYNAPIKGHTFSELSNSAKLKVLSLALYFDSKIETYFPGYKESISNTANKIYTDVKARIVSAYLSITTSICVNNEELCNDAKDNFATLKTNFGLTWSLIKDIAGDGLTNLKNWYEIWRE